MLLRSDIDTMMRARTIHAPESGPPMTDTITKPKIKDEIKVERPRLHKVILVNDDFTPREFVVRVLRAEFRMSEDQALRVMMTAHRRGAVCRRRLHKGCSGSQGNECDGCRPKQGLSLLFTTEPEE